MAASATTFDQIANDKKPRLRLGGYTALAESAWMGFALATEVAEQVWTAPGALLRQGRTRIARRPHLRLRGLSQREFSIAEASFILMASFFLSAAHWKPVTSPSNFGCSLPPDAAHTSIFREKKSREKSGLWTPGSTPTANCSSMAMATPRH